MRWPCGHQNGKSKIEVQELRTPRYPFLGKGVKLTNVMVLLKGGAV